MTASLLRNGYIKAKDVREKGIEYFMWKKKQQYVWLLLLILALSAAVGTAETSLTISAVKKTVVHIILVKIR